MKSFQFRLARVLHIRIAQERTEQQKLDNLQFLWGQTEREIRTLDEAMVRAQERVRGESSVSAVELSQLQSYELGERRLRESLVQRLSEQAQLVQVQSEVVIVARRNVKLLEHLREKQRGDWQAEANRETEAQASDFAAAQWTRLNP